MGSCSPTFAPATRSEDHTSELQSRGHLVCRLLLEKKKNAILTKLDDLIKGQNTKTGDDQIQSFLSRLNGLINKATRQQAGPITKTISASVAAYAETYNR